jgi:predicted esterase
MSKDANSIAKMEVRNEADLQAIQTSVAFKNISDAIEQYRRQFGVAFLALIAFSAIHVGLVVIANLYTLQTRVTHGVLTSASDDHQPVATSSVTQKYDLKFIMTNMNEVQQLKALRQLNEASFTDREGNFRQYSVTGFQLGGWRRSELKLYTSVGHVLSYVRGQGLRVLSEEGSTSSAENVTGRKLLKSGSVVSAELGNVRDSSFALSQQAQAANSAKEAAWKQKYITAVNQLGGEGDLHARESAKLAFQQAELNYMNGRAGSDGLTRQTTSSILTATEILSGVSQLIESVSASDVTAECEALYTDIMDLAQGNQPSARQGLFDTVAREVGEGVVEANTQGYFSSLGTDTLEDPLVSSSVTVSYTSGKGRKLLGGDSDGGQSPCDMLANALDDETVQTVRSIASMEIESMMDVLEEEVETYSDVEVGLRDMLTIQMERLNAGQTWYAADEAAIQYADYLDAGAHLELDDALTRPTLQVGYGCTGVNWGFIEDWWFTDVNFENELMCAMRKNGGNSYDPLADVEGSGGFHPWFEGYMFSTFLGYVEEFTIYFPETYCDEDAPLIPLVFMLHGFGGDMDFVHFIARAMDYCFQYYWHEARTDPFATFGVMAPPFGFVVACPKDGSGPWGRKSWYSNNLFTGFHMDFIAIELRGYIRSNTRTLNDSANRAGIFGFSMGGFGSFNIGFSYPGLFGFVGAFNAPADGNDCFFTKTCYMWCIVDATWCEILWIAIGLTLNPYVIIKSGVDINSPNSLSPMMHGNAVDLLSRGHYTGSSAAAAFAADKYSPSAGSHFVNCLMTSSEKYVPSVYVPYGTVALSKDCNQAGGTRLSESSWVARVSITHDSPALYGPPPPASEQVTANFCGQKFGCVLYCLEVPAWETDMMGQFHDYQYGVYWNGQTSGSFDSNLEDGESGTTVRSGKLATYWVNPVYSTMASQSFCPTINVLTDSKTPCYQSFLDRVPLGLITHAGADQFGSAVADVDAFWLFQSCDAQDEYGVFMGTLSFAVKFLEHMTQDSDAKYAHDVYIFDHTGLYGHDYCQEDIRKTLGVLSDYFFTRTVNDRSFSFSDVAIDWDASAGWDGHDDDDYTYWDPVSSRKLLAPSRQLLAGYYYRPPLPPKDPRINAWAASIDCSSAADCVPMCFTQSLYISEAYGKYEKMSHNSLVSEAAQKASPSQLCNMGVLMGKLVDDSKSYVGGLKIVVTDLADQPIEQPKQYFSAHEYAKGSAHNEQSSSHGAAEELAEWYAANNTVPDGTTVHVPQSCTTFACLSAAYHDRADAEAEMIAAATEQMESMLFSMLGAEYSAALSETAVYECLASFIDGMANSPLDRNSFIAGRDQSAIFSRYCPETPSVEVNIILHGSADSDESADHSTYKYWRFYRGKGGEADRWRELSAEEIMEVQIDAMFTDFESQLANNPYSEADCQDSLRSRFSYFYGNGFDALLAEKESVAVDRAEAEAERLANYCGEGEITVFLEQEFKGLMAGSDKMVTCVQGNGANSAWAEMAELLQGGKGDRRHLLKTSSEETSSEETSSECTPQDVYDFFTVNYYEFFKKSVLGVATEDDATALADAYQSVLDGTYRRPTGDIWSAPTEEINWVVDNSK